MESDLARFYRQNKIWQTLLTQFVEKPTIRTLFALGKDGNVKFRYYETVAEQDDAVKQIYAVTYLDEQKRLTTFFISLVMQRSVEAASGQAEWTLLNVEGGVRPAGW